MYISYYTADLSGYIVVCTSIIYAEHSDIRMLHLFLSGEQRNLLVVSKQI